MKIEEYLSSLPQEILAGDGIDIPDAAYADILDVADIKKGERFLHLGCGDGRCLALAQKRGALVSGVDSSQEKTERARKNCPGAHIQCSDVRDVDLDADVTLFWFQDEAVSAAMLEKFKKRQRGRVVVVLDPLGNFVPNTVRFPYLVYEMPLQREGDAAGLLRSIYGVDCMDFVTAWTYSEKYNRSLGVNDRFLTILQTITVWINAKNANLACEEMPESVRTYMQILERSFGIETKHLIKRGSATSPSSSKCCGESA